MISTDHKDEMHVAINKANQERTKPMVVCDYNVSILGVDMMDQMLQLLARMKERYQWYLKLFGRLFSVTICNTFVMYQSLPNNNNIDSLKFRLSLA
jgi:hypothetical protein